MSVDKIVPDEADVAALEAQQQAAQAATEKPETGEPAKDPAEDIPEKYRGKSQREIIEMHVNAERELGRARNEVGTVRKLADELLGIHRDSLKSSPEKRERPKVTTDALFSDPDTAITEVVRSEAEQREQALGARLERTEAQLALAAFEKQFPDYQQVMEDTTFQQWVGSSPYRRRLAQQAVQNDFEAASELFGLYKEVRAVQPATTTKPDTGAERAARETLTRPSGSAAAGTSATGAGKKIWSRAELIEMRIKDPDKFDALYESEILPAYAEKRVR